MYKIIAFAVLIVFSTTSFCQQIVKKPTLASTDYLQKSKKQKTAAWIITGTGATGLIVTTVVDAGQAVNGGLTTLFSLGTVEPEYKSYTVPYLLSAACAIGGVYLFIASSKNKKKANTSSAFFRMEKIPVYQQTVFSNQSVPSLALKISL